MCGGMDGERAGLGWCLVPHEGVALFGPVGEHLAEQLVVVRHDFSAGADHVAPRWQEHEEAGAAHDLAADGGGVANLQLLESRKHNNVYQRRWTVGRAKKKKFFPPQVRAQTPVSFFCKW